MTVAELIRVLRELPPTAEVRCIDSELSGEFTPLFIESTRHWHDKAELVLLHANEQMAEMSQVVWEAVQ
jgi:hypothetical protein